MNNWLDDLEQDWVDRIKRYRKKKLKAKGTDVINQGAKVKATTECLAQLRSRRRMAGV